jgi:opacity protein-like surface antigen
MRFKILIVLAILLVFSFSAYAQTGTVFAGYSYTNVDTNGSTDRLNFNGWEAGASYNMNKLIATEGIVAGGYKDNAYNVEGVGIDAKIYTYTFGPRVNLGPYAFAHFLVGGAHFTESATVSGIKYSNSDNSFAMSIGGGAQIKVARQVAVRTTFDFVPTYFGSDTQKNIRIGVGLAYLFGHDHHYAKR